MMIFRRRCIWSNRLSLLPKWKVGKIFIFINFFMASCNAHKPSFNEWSSQTVKNFSMNKCRSNHSMFCEKNLQSTVCVDDFVITRSKRTLGCESQLCSPLDSVGIDSILSKGSSEPRDII